MLLLFLLVFSFNVRAMLNYSLFKNLVGPRIILVSF